MLKCQGRELLASILLCAILFGHAEAKDLYAFDLKTKRPDLFKPFHAIVPKSLAKFDWFANLNGVSGPLKNGSVSGADYFFGSACEPHNCNMSYVNFLISTDGKRAMAMFVDDSRIVGAVSFVGNPTNQEKVYLLDQQMFR